MNPILHVMVIGFDHKKGSQIDFCYPPLVETVEPKAEDIPPEWENLPTLAIPDLAHTVLEDVIYFLLPSRESPNRSVFGISCYRQINANDLISKDDQVTRSHVQKSVCVVMRIPLYGFLKAKLELITHAYFNERDFSKVGVLHQMYNNLCDLFNTDFTDLQSATIGISLSSLVSIFRHRILILFKLLLLEKRVMFEIFPVNILGDVMMGLISLFPALLEEGLFEAASYSVRRFCSPSNLACEESHDNNDVRENELFQLNNHDSKISPDDIRIKIQDAVEVGQDIAATTSGDSSSNHNNPSSFNTNEYGFPLSIFTKGSLFHPYLSINQLDLIRSDNTRAYCIGVTNAIFKQRREFIDVIVSINEQKEGQIEILNPELRQQLSLSTQDLSLGRKRRMGAKPVPCLSYIPVSSCEIWYGRKNFRIQRTVYNCIEDEAQLSCMVIARPFWICTSYSCVCEFVL
uniref:UDENN domain-containing protein n=1 Tax=Acrobeloides nanus TaxID=290746 RepID=A0A914DUV4_9BILA